MPSRSRWYSAPRMALGANDLNGAETQLDDEDFDSGSVSDYMTQQLGERGPTCPWDVVVLAVTHPSPRRDGPSHSTVTQLTAARY